MTRMKTLNNLQQAGQPTFYLKQKLSPALGRTLP